MKRLLVIALTLALLAAVAAPALSDDLTIVFVPKLSGNAFFESANDGAQAYAEKIGFTVKYDGNPEASVANQVAIINNAINQGVDGICVSSVDATGLDDVMREAKAAGLAVTTWDSDVAGDARTVMVSQGTPDQLGTMLVDMLAESLKNRGKDPEKDAIKYVWHYSQATVADQNSWNVAGEAYVKEKYPNWVNVKPDNYYSEQDAEKAISIGESILSAYPDLDGIICNDSTALPGQCQAAQNLGKTKADISITGFAAPNSIKDYCRAGVLERWGLWDCQIQGALGCYLAYYLASGNTIKVGDQIDVPDIGTVEVMPNTVLDPNAYTAEDSGVVLLPERAVFTIDNMDNYNF
ncbi:MAG: substrate-binding domain-containing protein [Oscillospiraceae bacterium]|jgi:AI-2 transport system substrate-binding protein|nr:substrate-binding domain-containing protein [Oscillospiraceae bacterium]